MGNKWHGDWGNAQEPVYGRDGGVVGAVAYSPWRSMWSGISADGNRQQEFATRPEAERAVRSWASNTQVARRPQLAPSAALGTPRDIDQVTDALSAGAAFLGALGAFLGGTDQAEELRRQNEELRRQNELLRQALGQVGPKGIVRRK